MSINTSARPYPFPALEYADKFRVVGGSNLSAQTVVQLLTGKNTASSAIDGVAAGEYFRDFVCAASLTSYPEAGKSGISAVVLPFLGVLTQATNDDDYGEVVFRGLVKVNVVPINGGSAVTFKRGSYVILDASNSYAISVCDAAGDFATGDIVVGRLAADYTTAASAAAVEMSVFWDGINARHWAVGA